MGNFHPRKPFLFSGAADALTTDGLWRQLGSKVLRVYALDFLYEVKMLVSRDNRAFHLFPVSDREVHREQSLQSLLALCETFCGRLKAYLHLHGHALWQS